MTKTQIFNLALSHLGNLRVASDTEDSAEAEVLRTHWDNTRRGLLRRSAWNFAETEETLSAIEDGEAFDFAYGYQLPSDYLMCLKFNRIPPANQSTQFKIAGEVLYSDDTEAVLEYTRDETDCTKWDDEFCNALSYFLAAAIGPTLTKDPKTGMQLLQTAQAFLGEAKDSDTHESIPEVRRGPAYSPYHLARGTYSRGLDQLIALDFGRMMGPD